MLDKAYVTPLDEIRSALKKECKAIYDEDVAMCLSISESGLSLLKDGDGILTHCNAGPLATSRYGTALGPILLGQERGLNLRVYADETRPLLQGARLTMYELMKAGVNATLLCDNMAASAMKRGWINHVFVGCDRIAANGDAANKIGTMGVAILAKYFGIPFYVLGPSSTLDLSCAVGSEIEIEERDPSEISTKHYVKPMAPAGANCFNPAFDVTDHSLISGIITEKGIFRPPFDFSHKP
jgi:methylthioribose-1-phosphate isomerase